MIHFSLPGVHVPHRKNTANLPAVRMPAPNLLTFPVSQHIGAPAVPVVKVGDTVGVGQMLADAGGYVSSPIYSSVSGAVSKIDNVQLSSGAFVTAITVDSDSEMRVADSVVPPVINGYDDFINCVKMSGAVGLGGAGFPTHVKLDIKDLSRVDTVLINGAECEPYITSDTRTMIDSAPLVKFGLEQLHKYLDVNNIVIGIESNKPECIKTMREVTADMPYVSVKSLKPVYPQGGEKVLIYNITGRKVPEGKLPIDVGVIVLNCTTVATIANYIKTGMPLVEKTLTVDGGAIAKPMNVIVPLGTPISAVIDFCGGFKEEAGKVLCGGPMMGIALNDLETPVLKNNNAIIALSRSEAKEYETTQCIRCGRCVSACPLSLNPYELSRAYDKNDIDTLKKLKVNLCMECGCCSFICPTNQPLVQKNKLSKGILRNEAMKEAKK